MNRKTIDYFKVKNRKNPETQLQNSLFLCLLDLHHLEC